MKIRLFILIVILIPVICGATLIATNAVDRTRKVRIICTNDTIGYAEPCGCGGRREGGLARRTTLFAKLTKENSNCVIVESGNICDQVEKLDLITSILSNLKYDAIGIGPFDQRMGDKFFEYTAKNKLNVLDPTPKANKAALPYTIKTVDGVKVGIISFGYLPADLRTDKAVLDSLYTAYKKVRNGSDILILLDQAGLCDREWIEKTGASLGQPDIVMGGLAKGAFDTPEIVGKTRLLPTSSQGRVVVTVDVEIVPGAQPKAVTIKSYLLDESVKEDEAVLDRIRNELRSADVLASDDIMSSDTASGIYYYPDSCKSCHTAEYESWAKSAHAGAIKTLVKDGRVTPECLQCHSELYRKTQNRLVDKNTIGGVDCQSCHTVSIPHWDNQKSDKAKTKVDRSLCLTCHNAQRSPNYDEKKYWGKVKH